MKTFRRIFHWITVFAMLFTFMAPVFAAEEYGMTWEISEEGVLTISGAGTMKAAPWENQAEKVKKVVIEEGITSIWRYAFRNCVFLEEVVLPDSMKDIYGFAFPDSPYFKRIYIPSGVERIRSSAFMGCSSLERIDVSPENSVYASDSFGVLHSKDMGTLFIAPEGMTGSYRIADTVHSVGAVFYYPISGVSDVGTTDYQADYKGLESCDKLTHIEIPDTVEYINDCAFLGCSGIQEITIPDSVKKLGSSAFSGCSALKQVNIGSGLRYIGSSCFSECDSLEELVIPGNVWEIDYRAFSYCDVLEKIVFEPGIAKIGYSALLECPKLKEVQLPATLQKISDNMIRNCTSLKTITIPRMVTHIGEHAFDGCKSLRTVTYEGNAPTFGSVAFIEKGLYFHYPEDNETWDAIVGTKPGIYASITWVPYALGELPELPVYTVDLGRYDNSYDDTYLEWELLSSGLLTFSGTGSFENWFWKGQHDIVKKIVINDGCRKVGGFAGYPLLEEVVLPQGLRYIDELAFSACPNLRTIDVPQSVVFISGTAFQGCENLERINVASGNRSYVSDEFGVVYKKDMSMLLIAPEGLSGSYQIPEGVLSVGGTVDYSYLKDSDDFQRPSPFYGFRDCKKLTQIMLNKELTAIGESAFENCVGLTYMELPDSLKEIGPSAFGNCVGLKEISFLENVSVLGDYAFRNCDSLEKLTFPGGIKVIGTGCFRECDGFTEITIPGTVETVGTEAFMDCVNLEKLVLEDGITWIGYEAFQGCAKLKELDLPATIPIIEYRFRGCKALETVTIPANVRVIEHSVFRNCENLKEVTFEGNAPALTERTFPAKELVFYYPEGDETWDDPASTYAWLNIPITWVPYDAHNWEEATCDRPKTCLDCGLTAGEPLGHNWQEANCDSPKTCTVCGLTEGEALGHKWREANCVSPKTCTACGISEGEVLGHLFVGDTCTRCGKPDVPGLSGDVDGDGALSYNDSLTVLRASIGLATLTAEQEALADFDGDGGLSYNDALMILRASIGL